MGTCPRSDLSPFPPWCLRPGSVVLVKAMKLKKQRVVEQKLGGLVDSAPSLCMTTRGTPPPSFSFNLERKMSVHSLQPHRDRRGGWETTHCKAPRASASLGQKGSELH
ncbi:rCG58179 [Rattus norvegicus]|uniref:RCG58179 n=1 Tax=Rattus norvegicus TaxID=10116 RepID=A6J3Q5_RAT|nr:rCG58179 [Rattus norvegicus]